MGLRIGTNIAAIAANRALQENSRSMAKSFKALASGQRFGQPGDDPASFAISEGLRAQERGFMQAKRNAENAIGFLQVAEGGLSEQNNIIVRLREIAVQSASDTVGDEEREYLNLEFQQLLAEVDRIANSTRFGEKMLLTGSNEEYEFFLGTTSSTDQDVVRFRAEADTRADSLGISGLDVADQDEARAVLADLDDALNTISAARAGFGALQGRLEFSVNHLDVQRENVASARSRISDADIAEEVTELARGRILHDFGISVLAQANMNPERALRLL
ncbi:MAG TPA: flagellin [Pseudobdellovibrionaceae bacterium]|nr:flagellin [Pseudobdellovibrionaceae bacterium]